MDTPPSSRFTTTLLYLLPIALDHPYFAGIEPWPVVLTDAEFRAVVVAAARVKVDEDRAVLKAVEEAFKVKLREDIHL